MAEILKNNSFIALPSSIKRGNPAPLDVTEIWFSYDEMANYAATNVTAYVGQQMALVNENEKTAKVYIILNADGDLQEIGSGVLTDNLSVAINDESALHLHDYGVKYYKFIKAIGEEGAEGYIAAHYEPQIVDADHPWIEGLEPRVVLQGEDLVLGWYEPNPITIDGIQNQVTIVQGAIETLKIDVDKVEEDVVALEKNVENLTAEIGNPVAGESPASGLYAELNTKANASDVYTIEQADKAIADAVATVTGGESAAAVKLLLDAEVTRSTSKDDEHDIAINTITEKLNSIASGAQVNVIDSVEETEFSIDAVKKLSLLAVPAAKITGLTEHETIVTLSNSIVQNAQNIAANTNSITSLSDNLNNYVLNTVYSTKMTEIDADLAVLKDAVTWKEV